MNRITCTKCHMSFRIQVSPQENVEVSVCPDCNRHFWHGDNDALGPQVCICGVEPGSVDASHCVEKVYP